MWSSLATFEAYKSHYLPVRREPETVPGIWPEDENTSYKQPFQSNKPKALHFSQQVLFARKLGYQVLQLQRMLPTMTDQTYHSSIGPSR